MALRELTHKLIRFVGAKTAPPNFPGPAGGGAEENFAGWLESSVDPSEPLFNMPANHPFGNPTAGELSALIRQLIPLTRGLNGEVHSLSVNDIVQLMTSHDPDGFANTQLSRASCEYTTLVQLLTIVLGSPLTSVTGTMAQNSAQNSFQSRLNKFRNRDAAYVTSAFVERVVTEWTPLWTEVLLRRYEDYFVRTGRMIRKFDYDDKLNTEWARAKEAERGKQAAEERLKAAEAEVRSLQQEVTRLLAEKSESVGKDVGGMRAASGEEVDSWAMMESEYDEESGSEMDEDRSESKGPGDSEERPSEDEDQE